MTFSERGGGGDFRVLEGTHRNSLLKPVNITSFTLRDIKLGNLCVYGLSRLTYFQVSKAAGKNS